MTAVVQSVQLSSAHSADVVASPDVGVRIWRTLPNLGSQTGSQQWQTLNDAKRPHAIITAAKWRIERQQATSLDP